MVNNVIIGNIIALIASLIIIYYGFEKNKKKILVAQIVECILAVGYNYFLQGYTAIIVDILNIFLLILGYKDKLNNINKLIINICAVIFAVFFNNLGIIGYIPVIIIIIYSWGLNTKNIILFKLLNIGLMILWIIHDVTVKSYPSVVCEILGIIGAIYAIYKIKKNNLKDQCV